MAKIISVKLAISRFMINGSQLKNPDISGAIFTLVAYIIKIEDLPTFSDIKTDKLIEFEFEYTNNEFSICRGRQICQCSLINPNYFELISSIRIFLLPN